MAKAARGLFAILALLLPGISGAGGGRFDGTWMTTVSCGAIRDALGFSYRFPSEVKDSSFRGLHGAEGKPGFLLIEGKIAEDGRAELYATGKTGSKEYVPGRDTPRGTDYGYHIKAKFSETKGTGTRVEGRPCSLEFVKR
jgi:hypothetical protein